MLDMRYPESKIKAAILHAEKEVRLTALGYFADSFTADESIMQLVIEAVEKYGHESAFGILRDAERLPQTEATLDWLMSELRRDYNLNDIGQDNFRFAIGLVVLAAPLDLLALRKREILDCPAFAKELRPALQELVDMVSWDWQITWDAFTGFCERLMGQEELTNNDHRRLDRLTKTLARFPDDGADQVLALLKRRHGRTNRQLMEWMESCIVDLAGRMRVKEAIPFIIERIFEDDETVQEECETALTNIGGNEVVQAIEDNWEKSDEEFRELATDVLARIHTDICAEKCLEFLVGEEDGDVQLSLGNAVLSHFTLDGIDLVRQLVLGDEDELHPDQWDLRHKLVATVTIMGVSFPEYVEWHQEALESEYGWGDYEPTRIADNFQPDAVHGGNGKPKRRW